jgi:O-antigen/teichoic acid export membrane protein
MMGELYLKLIYYKNKLPKGSILTVIQIVIKTFASLITVPLTINYLGNERYAVWVAALTIVTFISFLDAGITPTILNKLSTSSINNDDKEFKSLFHTGIYIGVLILLLSIIFGLISPFIPIEKALNISSNVNINEIKILFSVLIIMTGLTLSLAIIDNVYYSKFIGHIPKIGSIFSSGLAIIFVGICAYFELGLPFLAIALLFPTILYRIILFFGVSYFTKIILFPLTRIKLNIIWDFVKQSFWFLLIRIFNWIFSASATLILPTYVGLIFLTDFNINQKPYLVILSIVSALQPLFWPYFTKYWNTDIKLFKLFFKKIIIINSLALALFSFVFLLIGPWFIKFWTLGNVTTNRTILFLFSVWLILQSIVWWYSTFLHSISDFKFEVLIFGIGAFMLILTSYVVNLMNLFNLATFLMSVNGTLLITNLIPMVIRVRYLTNERKDYIL